MDIRHSPKAGNVKKFVGIFCLLIFASNSYLAFASPHRYDLPISQVRVFGNEKTQTRFILKWANLKPGDILTQDRLKKARQNIRDTSLFKEVDIKTVHEDDQTAVNIHVEEKYFTLILPRLGRNSNGDIKSGVKLRMHNIDGADQSLSMLVEQTDRSDGDETERYRIDYKLPQYSRPYYYKWRIGESNKETEEQAFRNTERSQFISFSISRNMHTSLFQLPIIFSVKLKLERVTLAEPYPVSFNEIEAGNFNRLGIEFEYDNVHEQRFRRYGRYFSLSYQQGLGELESDYVSRIIEFESQIFRPLSTRDNFNSRFFIGVSDNSPFNSPFYDLGGADNVRGLERDVATGNALVFGNFEYVTGYTKYPSFRSSVFVDIGNVFEDSQDIDFGDLFTTFGFGMRWKLTSFIKTDLFMDIAYDPDSEQTKAYGGTSLSF